MNTTDRILGEAEASKVRPPTDLQLTCPLNAYTYARDVVKGRWPEGEATIAKDPDYAKLYLEQFPEAKLEWLMNGWLDWLDL